MSYSIPQVNISSKGELVSNSGENLVSNYHDVHYEKCEGEIYITNVRLVWIGKRHKGGLLGTLVKAAIVVGLAAVATVTDIKAKSVGSVSGIGGAGRVAGALVMSSLVTKNQDGYPVAISMPYEVITDIQVGKNGKEMAAGTQAGSFIFRLEKGDAETVANEMKLQRLIWSRMATAVLTGIQSQYNGPPQYPKIDQSQTKFHYCPHCGTRLGLKAKFCHNCGASVD